MHRPSLYFSFVLQLACLLASFYLLLLLFLPLFNFTPSFIHSSIHLSLSLSLFCQRLGKRADKGRGNNRMTSMRGHTNMGGLEKMILQSIALWLHCIAMPCFFSSFFFLSISLSFSVLGCNWGLPFLSFQLAWKELLSFFLALQFCVGEDSLKVYCFCNGFRFTTSARAAQWLFGCLGLLSPIYANVFCQITT